MKPLYLYIGGTALAVILSALAAWFIFANSPAPSATTTTTTTYGSTNNNAVSGGFAAAPTTTAPNTPQQATGMVVTQARVFKLSDGPVAGATFVQTYTPTTTLARFVMADTGHAYDLAIDVEGAVAKPLSNTTIPGAVGAYWGQGSAVLQYLDNATPKTVYLGLPAAGATSSAPARLSFYPDGITAIAVAPNGKQAAYVLHTAAGTDGYIANLDGSGGKKLFSLPLAQVQLRWPAQGTLLAYSNAAADVPGIAFSVDAKSGAVTPLLSAAGLTAVADTAFRHVVYQKATADTHTSYDHDLVSGGETALSFSPFPEQCVQSPLGVNVIVCAVPLGYVPGTYIDSRHQGATGAADSLVVYDLARGTSGILATPGSATDGGIATDMLQLAVSPDGHYALFVSKYDRSLWAVRLTN